MLTFWLIGIIGRFIAFLPKWIISVLCYAVGWIFFTFFRRRRTITISNFLQAFPQKSLKECKKLALLSSVRVIELGLLAIALPYFSEKKIRRSFKGDPSIDLFFQNNPQEPALILVPHFSQMEALTVLPLLYPELKKRSIGVLYRPFCNKALEGWVKQTRERFGLKLLARNRGLFGAYQILKHKGIVVVLFDQNARNAGILCDFMGRIASTTPLPDLLYRKFHCPVYALLPKRTGVFSATFSLTQLSPDSSPDRSSRRYRWVQNSEPKTFPTAEVVQQNDLDLSLDDAKTQYPVMEVMNRWLEQQLRNEELCYDWLWVHNRWHICDEICNWLTLTQRLNAIHWETIRKVPRVFVLMPDDPLNVNSQVLAPLRVIHQARPDCQILLLVNALSLTFYKELYRQNSDYIDQIIAVKYPCLGHFSQSFKQLLAYRLPQALALIDGANDHRLSYWIKSILHPKILIHFPKDLVFTSKK